MKTCCVTSSVSRNAGGLFVSVRRLHQELSTLPNMTVEVLSLEDKYTGEDIGQWPPLKVRVVPVRGPIAFGFSTGLLPALGEGDFDLVHIHGLWMYPSVAVSDWHERSGRPHVISPRGMLDSWALANSRWKKRIAGWLFENRHLRGAACLHALCESEARSMRLYGLKNPIAVIPNGMDLPHQPGTANIEPPASATRCLAGRRVLLYLGRIHPKKGLAQLLRAWALVAPTHPEWLFVVAGWDQGGHEAELQRLCAEVGIPWADRRTARLQPSAFSLEFPPLCSVLFLGPRFGAEKEACYRICDAFVLPSFSEGLPMVVLEAWAYGKPVLMTPECNIPEGFAAGAAFRVETTEASLIEGLRRVMGMSDADLRSTGAKGGRLVSERFAWPRLARETRAVYEWLNGGGPKPECVWE